MSEKPDYSYLNPHPSLLEKLRGMSYSQMTKYLKEYFTKGEQKELIRRTKNLKSE